MRQYTFFEDNIKYYFVTLFNLTSCVNELDKQTF